MGTLKVILSKISGASKSLFEYETYKYEEIQSEWIIHQDHLQYLYNTTLRGDSLFKTYRVVLARVPIQNMEDIIGLYLYSDEKKSPGYFFPIDRNAKISDRCDKIIKSTPKCFLFQLKFVDKDKPEIFGTKDHADRKIWMEKIKTIFSKSLVQSSVSELSYLQPISTEKLSSSFNEGHGLFYRPYPADYAQQHNNNDQSHARSESDLSFYLEAESNKKSQSSINAKREELSPVLRLPPYNDSYLSEEKTFVWNDIYYSNEKDDYRNVLMGTGGFGSFLIRPQSKLTNSSNHNYTLCFYHRLNDIRCFGIYQFPTQGNEYSLSKKGVKRFVDMIELCQYYTTNPLPMTIENVYLQKPYKY